MPNGETVPIQLRTKVTLGLITICLVWGTTWLAIKVGLTTMPPFLGASLRFLLAAGILWLILKVRNIPLSRDRLFWNLGMMMGVLSFSIPFGLVYWGQQHIPTGLSSILFAMFPLAVGVFSHFRLPEEEMNPAKWMGSVLGFVGIAVIFSSDFVFASELVVYGMAAVVLSAVIQAFAVVMVKRHGKTFDASGLSLVGMMLGGILLGFASLATERPFEAVFTGAAIGSILYLATIGSIVTFVTYYWLLKRVEAVMLSLTAFVTPIVTVIVGFIFLGERLPARILQGSALVLAGILLANSGEVWRVIKRGRTFLIGNGRSAGPRDT